jgi:hypothetical protein
MRKVICASSGFLSENAHSPTKAPIGMPGGFLSISANDDKAGTGILWGSHPLSGDANHDVRPGILHAYDAENVGRELWNSEQNSKRDAVGNFSKFCPPTVANGKVYLPRFLKNSAFMGRSKRGRDQVVAFAQCLAKIAIVLAR